MTGDEILSQVAARLNYKDGLTTDARTRLLGYLNNRHRQAVSKVPKVRDITGVPAFTSVNGQQAYSLSPSIKSIKHLYDPTQRRFLTPVSAALIRSTNPGGAVTNFGVPVRYADIGYVSCQFLIPSANTLWVVSSSSADTTQTAFVEYQKNGGYPQAVAIVLTGNTAVQLGSDTDIVNVTKFHLSNTAVGFVTLRTANGAGTVISTLGPGQTFARFRGILLDPTPSANITYYADYKRVVTDFVLNSNDEPLIDEDWQWLLVSGVLMDEYGKNSNGQGFLQAKNEWDQGLKDMVSDIMDLDDWIVVPTRGALPDPYPFRIPVTDQ